MILEPNGISDKDFHNKGFAPYKEVLNPKVSSRAVEITVRKVDERHHELGDRYGISV